MGTSKQTEGQARAANLKEWAASLTSGEIAQILTERRSHRAIAEIKALVCEENRRKVKDAA